MLIGYEGAACLLVHDEEPDMADLWQLTLHGTIRDGTRSLGEETTWMGSSCLNMAC